MKIRIIILSCILVFSFIIGNLHASEYHNYINKAENSIIINNPAEALKFYELAFKEVDFPLAKDLNNALLLSIKEKQPDEALKFAIALAQKGVGLKFFLENKKLESLKENAKEWNKVIQTATTSKKFINTENKEVLDQIDSLVSSSAKARKELRYLAFNKKELRQKTVHEVYHCGADLEMIFNKYGYLSEEYIGVTMLNDTTINPLPAFALIIKNQLMYTEFGVYDMTGLNKYLYSALLDNKIDPQVYALFQSGGISMGLGILSYFELNNKLYTQNSFDKIKINKKRMEIHLCTIETSLKKSNFQSCNPNTPFIMVDYSFYTPNKVNNEEIISHMDRYKIIKESFPVCANP